MFTSRLRSAVLVGSAMLPIVFGPIGAVSAQQAGRVPAVREIRGIVKSVDAKKGAITVATAEGPQSTGEKTFTLAKEAEIALGRRDRAAR